MSPTPTRQAILVTALSITTCGLGFADDAAQLRERALTCAKNATQFLSEEVSTKGGYLWRYSSDLSLREGEGRVTTQTIWVQPPGTPSIGEAFVHLYNATGEAVFLDAAQETGEALRLGQMISGGWQAMVEFELERRTKWMYRTNQRQSRRAKDQSSLDDDKTQSAIRFVIQLDRALAFKDPKVHEMALYALSGLLEKGQLPNGGFPQVWTDKEIVREAASDLSASFPESWSRKYEGHQEYWYRYTLNDNLAPDVLDTLFLAHEIYEDQKYLDAALKLADFLLLAQLPEPQPAWAQQYNFRMQPIWARKFEPASVTGGESQGVMETLLSVYAKTGNLKYLKPIPAALTYLQRSALPDGSLARFYELKTNRPLFFTKDYVLTYDDSDVPTHYSFKVANRLSKIRRQYELAKRVSHEEFKSRTKRIKPVSEDEIKRIVNQQDDRGAWVTDTGMRYHKQPGAVIDMRVANENLRKLAVFLSAK